METCKGHEETLVRLAKGEAEFAAIAKDYKQIIVGIGELKEGQRLFDKKLFIDNGTPCVQTRLISSELKVDALSASMKTYNKMIIVFGTAIFGLLCDVIYTQLIK